MSSGAQSQEAAEYGREGDGEAATGSGGAAGGSGAAPATTKGLDRTESELDHLMRVRDYLNVRENSDLRDTLRVWKLQARNREQFYGLVPARLKERVYFSVAVNKVNRKGKTQRRALIITNLAVYNFKTNDYGSFMRRIPIADLGSFIRVKGEPTVFVLHTWEPAFDYDYMYEADEEEHVESAIQILQDNFHRLTDERLGVREVARDDLAGVMQVKATCDARRAAAGAVENDMREDRYRRVAANLEEHLAPAPTLGSLLVEDMLDEIIEEGSSDDASSDDSDSEEEEGGVKVSPAKGRVSAASRSSGKVLPPQLPSAPRPDGDSSGAADTAAPAEEPAADTAEGAVAPPKVKRRSSSGRTKRKSKERRLTGFVGDVDASKVAAAAAAAAAAPDAAAAAAGGEATEKETWVEKTDPTTGRTYYVHPKTRKSVWVLPEGAVSIKRTRTITKEDAAAAKAEEEKAAAEKAAAAEAAAIEAAEAAFFFKQEEAAEAAKAAVEAEADAEPSQEELENTYTAYLDPDSGATFYVNAASGESVWTLPDGATMVSGDA